MLIRVFIYLFPVLINYTLGGMFFITALRYSQAGAHKMLVTGTMAVWALVYSLVSLGLGRVITEKRAPKLIVGAGLAMSLVFAGFILVPSESAQFIWIALIGLFTAMYCAPFQVYMKGISSGAQNHVVYATAMYTAAWSLGLGTGPFIFGWLEWRTGYVINIVLALLMAAGVGIIEIIRRRQPQTQQTPETPAVPAVADLYERRPDLAWLGWVMAAGGVMAISGVRTLEPNLAVTLGLPKAHAGMILALVSGMQVIWPMLLLRGRTWMYGPLPAVLSGIAGLAGLLLYAFGTSLPLLYLASFLFGCYSSYFYFCMVFFALAHPTSSSRYVATNEAVVGIAGIVGSILCGAMAHYISLSFTFTALAMLVCGCSLFGTAVLWRQSDRWQEVIG